MSSLNCCFFFFGHAPDAASRQGGKYIYILVELPILALILVIELVAHFDCFSVLILKL